MLQRFAKPADMLTKCKLSDIVNLKSLDGLRNKLPLLMVIVDIIHDDSALNRLKISVSHLDACGVSFTEVLLCVIKWFIQNSIDCRYGAQLI